MTSMALQLQLDVGVRPAAAIEAVLVAELDHFRRLPVEDAANAGARAALIRGHEMLLAWLAATPQLPDEPLAWPCSACMAGPGEPCDIPGPRTKWTPPGPRYHLDRGLHGRWSGIAGGATR